jgi:hypothetical protein
MTGEEKKEIIKNDIDHMINVIKFAQSNRGKDETECPKCKGIIKYTVAINNHVHAKCESKNCLNFMM